VLDRLATLAHGLRVCIKPLCTASEQMLMLWSTDRGDRATKEIAGDKTKVRAMRAARAAGMSVRAIAAKHGVGVGSVQWLTA
jgi:hypothetical protein